MTSSWDLCFLISVIGTINCFPGKLGARQRVRKTHQALPEHYPNTRSFPSLYPNTGDSSFQPHPRGKQNSAVNRRAKGRCDKGPEVSNVLLAISPVSYA